MRTTMMTVLAAALIVTTTLLGVAMAADKGDKAGKVAKPAAEAVAKSTAGDKAKTCPWGEWCDFVVVNGKTQKICKAWCPPACTACTN